MEDLGELLGGLLGGIFGGAAEAVPELAADEVARKLTGDGSLEGTTEMSPTRYLVGARRVLNINDL